MLGRVPQSILDDEDAHVITAHENCLDLQNLKRVSENAYKQYLKSRPNPSPESIKRVKNSDLSSIAVHPLLGLWVFNTRLKSGCLDDLLCLEWHFLTCFQGQDLRRWSWTDCRWLTRSRLTSQNPWVNTLYCTVGIKFSVRSVFSAELLSYSECQSKVNRSTGYMTHALPEFLRLYLRSTPTTKPVPVR